METITTRRNVDLEELSGKIVSWLNEHNWDTEVRKTGDKIWKIVGKKEGFFRDFFCNKGKVNVSILKEGDTTEIQIDDHSFSENWLANGAWAVATGGTNLLLTAAGKVGIHRLSEYIHELV
ncbi:MAG TPA: hypothetical protein V6C78_29550 [Crinalium sp.]|jgi:hypothetical protein